jgi:hypothetical protein
LKKRRVVGGNADGKPDIAMIARGLKGTLAESIRDIVRCTPANVLYTDFVSEIGAAFPANQETI